MLVKFRNEPEFQVDLDDINIDVVKEKFDDFIESDIKLGCGEYSNVLLCKHRVSKVIRVMKIVKLELMSLELTDEITEKIKTLISVERNNNLVHYIDFKILDSNERRLIMKLHESN